MEAIVGQGTGEAHIGRRMDQNVITLGAEHIHGCGDTAQNAIGVADVFRFKALHAVALAVPADDAVIVLSPGAEVAVGGVLCAFDDGFGDGRAGQEIHVGYPHGDQVKALLGLAGRVVHGDGIHTFSFRQGGKIVFHKETPLMQLFSFIIEKLSENSKHFSDEEQRPVCSAYRPSDCRKSLAEFSA